MKLSTFIVIFIILTIFSIISISSINKISPVCDEVSHHIGNGYSFLVTGDFRLNSTQPPLMEQLSAIPLLFLKPRLPLDHPSWDNIDRSTFGFQFLYRYGNDANKIMFWSRIPIVLVSVLCGILVFVWAKQLYGEKSGILALFFYAFSTTVLAYSNIVTADMGVSFFILLASYRFYKFLKKPKAKNILLAGIALGLAQASKLTALILLPLFFIIVLFISLRQKRIKYVFSLIAIYGLCYLVVFCVYLGEVKPLLKNDIDMPRKIENIRKGANILFPGNQAISDNIVRFATEVPIPLATYSMNILSSTNMVFKQKIFDVFYFGEYSQSRFWHYYLMVFLLKTQVPIFILIFLTIIYFRKLKPKDSLSEIILLSFPIAFLPVALTSKLQLAVRYILPMYPFLFIYISKIVNIRVYGKRFLNTIIILSCFWYLFESVKIYPYYISYFNHFAGGADNGWKYLRYDNMDYGQDLISLADYMKQNNIDEIKLSYSGTADPDYYGIKYNKIEEMDRLKPRGDIYAVSVQYIDSFKWAKNILPTAKAGYSIFIYDFR
jgi:hypothetical protein